MTGRTLFIGLALFLIVFAGGLYYALNYAHYDATEYDELAIGTPAGEITLTNVVVLDGTSSPLKYRACADEVDLSAYPVSDEGTPLVAPKWFECFNAGELQQQIDQGQIETVLIAADQPFGVNLMATNYQGRSYFWHQLSACGDARFSGDPIPDNCPEIDE